MRKFSILINPTPGGLFAEIPIVEDPTIPPNCCVFKSDQGEWYVDFDKGTVQKHTRLVMTKHDKLRRECLMTWHEFIDGVRCNALTDYDGWADLATATEYSNVSIHASNTFETIREMPEAEYPAPPYEWVTHVCWYNK